ncbi:MAG: glycosyltransferase family 2 protein [Longimicrobiales bacterium]
MTPLVKDVTIAIVSYNTRDLLETCLKSAVAEGPESVIVVDNASTDGSPQMVRSRFPDVTLISSQSNLGYAAAVNEAVRAAQSPYVLVLNADTTLLPGSLVPAKTYMGGHPRAAVAGPLLLTPGHSIQPSYFPFPGTLAWLVENNPIGPIARYIPFVRGRLLRYTRPNGPFAVPWVLGAALLIRRKAFDDVGGFDTSYFMYYEEVDFCFRLKSAGWEVHFVPMAKVTHVGGASTSQRRTEMTLQHYDSTVRYYRRHYHGPRLVTWLWLVRIKMVLCYARDGLVLRFAGTSERRLKAAERTRAWRLALFGRNRS